jgi:CheY-like chemotaxis protein
MGRVEQALSVLPCVPFDLIIMDSRLSRPSSIEFLRLLRDSIEWQTIPVFVITNSLSADFAEEAAGDGAFLARESTWARDLSYFLAGLGFEPFAPMPGRSHRLGATYAGK